MANATWWWTLGIALSACSGAGGNGEVVVIDAATPPRDTGTRDAGTLDARATFDLGPLTFDVRPRDVPPRDVQPNYDAFFAENPLPQYCGPDGGGDAGRPPVLPGGTAACPDDLTREGCPCTTIGEMHSCWPGLRVNRNRGLCHDGMTRCEPYDELGGRWGACEGYTLPDPAVRLGPASC